MTVNEIYIILVSLNVQHYTLARPLLLYFLAASSFKCMACKYYKYPNKNSNDHRLDKCLLVFLYFCHVLLLVC